MSRWLDILVPMHAAFGANGIAFIGDHSHHLLLFIKKMSSKSRKALSCS